MKLICWLLGHRWSDWLWINFSIPAANQAEACDKLTSALAKIMDELKAMPRKPLAS